MPATPPEDFLAIDKMRLDQSWLRQPSLRYKYGKECAEARRIRDELKIEVVLVRSSLQKKVRASPEEYGLTEKVTEAGILACIESHAEYLDAQRGLRQAQYNLDVFEAAVGALDDRKWALQNLVELHKMNYSTEAAADSAEAHVAGSEPAKRTVRTLGQQKYTK